MNVAVKDVRVDPMFVSLVRAHGFTPESRALAEQIIARSEKPKPKPLRSYRRNVNEWLADRCPWPCFVEGNLHAEMIRPESTYRITVREIIEVVADHYGLTEAELLSARRDNAICCARQIAMYLAKKLTKASYPVIGKYIGRRDHTTVIYGVRKVESLMEVSEAFSKEVETLRAKVEEGVA